MRLLILILLAVIFYGVSAQLAVYTNYPAYEYHLDVRVNHPEFIPSNKSISYIYSGYDQMFVDIFWIQAIQYIGDNGLSGAFYEFLYAYLDFITDIEPQYESPYLLGLILAPTEGQRGGENADFLDIQALAEKGVESLCGIDTQTDITDKTAEFILANPAKYSHCSSYSVPYYLGYLHMWGKKDAETAAKYYVISSFYEDAPIGVGRLAASLRGRGGEKTSAMLMFLGLASSSGTEGVCPEASSMIENIWIQNERNNGGRIPGELLLQIEDVRLQVVEIMKESQDIAGCVDLLSKAVRHLKLAYLDQYTEQYFEQFDEYPRLPRDLSQAGLISYVPTDHQKQEAARIIYYYNSELEGWDYKWGKMDGTEFPERESEKDTEDNAGEEESSKEGE